MQSGQTGPPRNFSFNQLIPAFRFIQLFTRTPKMIDPLLLATTRITTYRQDTVLTSASGFFFERNGQLYLVTSLHVMQDNQSNHMPDRLEIELHSNPENFAESVQYSIPLYKNGSPLWREWVDRTGKVDIAVIELDKAALPENNCLQTFTESNLPTADTTIPVGEQLLITGFPLGFHDTLHHCGVVRRAALASVYGLRFQGFGFFLTDARTHRGSSGGPVVMKISDRSRDLPDVPYYLLGVHSSRFDMITRDASIDEALGLNCAWYADVLVNMTQ